MNVLPFVGGLFLLVVGSAFGAQNKEQLAATYLNDPKTSKEIKTAIERGIIVLGMCPHHAFAAAGFPVGVYHVRMDETRWSPTISPLKVIDAQCEYPDNSVIDLSFKNSMQFISRKPLPFRVQFVRGKVVSINQKKFNAD